MRIFPIMMGSGDMGRTVGSRYIGERLGTGEARGAETRKDSTLSLTA